MEIPETFKIWGCMFEVGKYHARPMKCSSLCLQRSYVQTFNFISDISIVKFRPNSWHVSKQKLLKAEVDYSPFDSYMFKVKKKETLEKGIEYVQIS